MDKVTLLHALAAVLAANDALAQTIMEKAEQLRINPYELQNPDGTYPMMMILNTRSNVLLALTNLRLS
jgi:hypothetical protein